MKIIVSLVIILSYERCVKGKFGDMNVLKELGPLSLICQTSDSINLYHNAQLVQLFQLQCCDKPFLLLLTAQ